MRVFLGDTPGLRYRISVPLQYREPVFYARMLCENSVVLMLPVYDQIVEKIMTIIIIMKIILKFIFF